MLRKFWSSQNIKLLKEIKENKHIRKSGMKKQVIEL